MSGKKSLKLVGLDSDIFIYHFEDNPRFNSFTEKIFEKLLEGWTKGTTSVISLIETLSYPLSPKLVKEINDAFLSIPNLHVVDVDHDIGFEAAKIRREYGFRLPDSIQLATALQAKVQAFVTNDQKLKRFKRLPIILLDEV